MIWGTMDQSQSMEKSWSESSGNRLLGNVKKEKVTGNSQHGFTQGEAFGIANGTQSHLSFLGQQLSLLTKNSLFHGAKQKVTFNLLSVYTFLFTNICSVLKEQTHQRNPAKGTREHSEPPGT
ncbi:hypothetical protein GRJ2_000436800 [Grus japonensis]|uniref:Uncharacterized protein n=1 Tax=Grus japonensis TaxID=30415 RepID=A0ABC9W3R7_GRUJA